MWVLFRASVRVYCVYIYIFFLYCLVVVTYMILPWVFCGSNALMLYFGACLILCCVLDAEFVLYEWLYNKSKPSVMVFDVRNCKLK